MSTPTTETPETLRALAVRYEDDASTTLDGRLRASRENAAAELRARADELERHIAEAAKDSAFRHRVETVGIVQTSRELESAGKGETHTPGPLHVGGIFAPNSDRPTCNIWGPTPKGKQSGNIIAEDCDLKDARLLAAAYTSYDRHYGPGAVEAAETDQLGEALAALRDAPKDNDAAALRTNYCRWLDEVRDPILARATGGKS